MCLVGWLGRSRPEVDEPEPGTIVGVPERRRRGRPASAFEGTRGAGMSGQDAVDAHAQVTQGLGPFDTRAGDDRVGPCPSHDGVGRHVDEDRAGTDARRDRALLRRGRAGDLDAEHAALRRAVPCSSVARSRRRERSSPQLVPRATPPGGAARALATSVELPQVSASAVEPGRTSSTTCEAVLRASEADTRHQVRDCRPRARSPASRRHCAHSALPSRHRRADAVRCWPRRPAGAPRHLAPAAVRSAAAAAVSQPAGPRPRSAPRGSGC